MIRLCIPLTRTRGGALGRRLDDVHLLRFFLNLERLVGHGTTKLRSRSETRRGFDFVCWFLFRSRGSQESSLWKGSLIQRPFLYFVSEGHEQFDSRWWAQRSVFALRLVGIETTLDEIFRVDLSEVGKADDDQVDLAIWKR
jgi:hypothetical protein